MPCYHPIVGWRSRAGRNPKTGLWPIVFNRNDGYTDKEVTLPCGKCIGCRLEKSRIWAFRCVQEASMYELNCFVTLTYNERNVALDGSLNKRDFVLFMKKLRKKYGEGIRYFHCGEYGSQFGRPHHHACIFNFDVLDKKPWRTKSGNILYVSEELDKMWGHGYTIVGNVTFESAAYVARYITKKITGKMVEEHYRGRLPEYVTMSKGIGRGFYEKYRNDMFPSGRVRTRDGIIGATPRFYNEKYRKECPDKYERMKLEKKRLAEQMLRDSDELLISELVMKSKFKKLKRSYEDAKDVCDI